MSVIAEAKSITKVFPGVLALNDVSIAFQGGTIHCIVGENGAGKSTLIKCLTGVYKPESGDILINGKSALENPELFDQIVFVPQEIDLFPHLTVAENLFIPFNKTNIKGLVNQKTLEARALPIIKKFEINAKPSQIARELSVADQQLLQIARATMHENYRAIILDEPTSSLTQEDANRVFSVMRHEKENGIAVIFISHKLDEVFEIGDEVTVFRNGEKIASAPLDQVDATWIVQKMIGKYIEQSQFFYSNHVRQEDMLRVNHLYGPGFHDVSFTLKKGEVLGFAGLIGAGRTEVMLSVFGSAPIYSGSVWHRGVERSVRSTNRSVREGLIYLPEDRKKKGILAKMPVYSNISILSLNELVKHGMISAPDEKRVTTQSAEQYNIRASSLNRDIRFLSGGNQQKAIIARSMMAGPEILIMDEPTKGIDVGAKYEIYKLMQDLAESGLGVIFVSSELDEIIRCCNRTLVMYDGTIVDAFGPNPDREQIMSAMIGKTKRAIEVE